MHFRKELLFLIVTNSVMAFLSLTVLILTCIKRREICSGYGLVLILTAFVMQAALYGVQY